jgi:phosphatidylglycerophosphate synthase
VSRRLYLAAAGVNAAAIVGFTILARRRLGGDPLAPPNLLTLARAGCALPLAGTAASGRSRRPAFWALLVGCSVLDWLDGPLARWYGPTPLGALLDIEADSWLTLWGAAAAVRLHRLPWWSLLAPLLRYALTPGIQKPLRPWQRAAGVGQMMVLVGALGRRCVPSAAAAAAAAIQLAALVVTVRERETVIETPRD